MSKTNTGPREGITWAKISRSLSLIFQPSRLTTYLSVKRFEEISLNKLLRDGMQGILIDADGTIGPHHTREFDTSILEHVQKMLEQGLKVAIYTNAFEDRFQSFKKIGGKIVSNVPPKPDPNGFDVAMKKFLNLQDPSKVCMVGDNYITDGGAIDAGMHFIYIQPIKGKESFIHALTRYLAYLCARIYKKIPVN